MEYKARSEMDPRFQWDMSHIFESTQAWEEAYAKASELISGLPVLQGTLGASAEALKNACDRLYEAAHAVELVYVYAFLCKSSDNGDPANQTMEGRATNLYVSFSTASSFFTPEVLAIEEDVLTKYINDPILSSYRHILEDTARGRAHTLDAAGEKMLAMLGDAAQSSSNTFEMFESVDMTFPKIRDEHGNEVTLTHGNFSVFRESKDARVRRESFEAYFGEFKKYINTLASMYAGSVKMDTYFTDVRGYSSACERALFGNNVPITVYDSLVDAIHDGLPTMKRYLALRKRVLGLETLNMYDLYTPIVDDVDFSVSYEEAKTLVKSAAAPLGERYAALLDEAYANHWMDVYENKGKTTGAFSCGVYGVHPYVLLNYTDTLDDAYTMAHELGHAMHSYFSSEANDFANHDYRIMVAEVASTVNEVLLTKYLLATETDKKKRAFILNHLLEGFRTTVFRQTLFAEFERRAHDMYKQGIPLTAENLNREYRALNERYYEGAFINELQDIEWARIPHFYRAFYVYQYATGFCSAVAIANH
ncbi:MAG: oligoendopeptidase F, partial [Clostridia bacterium]|nr:oligoendopeptidase F [Clostridia bacterium]